MKYGTLLEQQSVPEWSLHNLDYNSLKHKIRAHTTATCDQPSAIAIPGQQDQSLTKFEDGLYVELCRQHDRLGLFVTSKSDEVARRLDHLARRIDRWTFRCAASCSEPAAPRQQRRRRRLAECERELVCCGEDIQALPRFVQAQTVAFRKIVKKYRKWTGSTTLGTRFRHDVLSDPQSFTRRDFTPLRQSYERVLGALRGARAHPGESDGGSPDQEPPRSSSAPGTPPRRTQRQHTPLPREATQVSYWNEFEDGSDTETSGGEYVIFVNPDDRADFIGLSHVRAVWDMPVKKLTDWFRRRDPPEEESLLANGEDAGSYGSVAATSDPDEEGSVSSDTRGPLLYGPALLPAHRRIGEQRAPRQRDRARLWGIVSAYVASFVVLAIASLLISTAQNSLRVEVDAAVTFCVVISLSCACSAVGMSHHRPHPPPILHSLMVWSAFAAACTLNGMLLILVVSNVP